MGLLKGQELLRLPNSSLSHIFQSSSAVAIKRASSPEEALCLYRTRMRRWKPGCDPFDSHAAVFAIKACSSGSGSGSGTSTANLIPHLHAHLLKSSLRSHVFVATALLHGYSLCSFHDARLLFDEIPTKNVVTTNTMLTCYSNYGDLNAARSLFNSMLERDLVSWSAMIGGYMKNGHRTLGLALFREMMSGGQFKPDQSSLVIMLSGCADTGSLRLLGKSIHAYCAKNGMEINEHLGTSLINMYTKSGCLRSAFWVFERMSERTVMHWTAMICGLALHGHGREAVAFFEQMKTAGVKPNEITFTGVLNGCCYAGLVVEGQRYFCSMIEEFACEPGIHHYGCMVDLFAKAGRLEDAYSVIQNMTVEPNIVVWSSFLSACKKYKNFEIAEKVMEQVLQMAIPDEDGGVFTLISDLYALGGKWNDVERVRKLMDGKSVKKNRGSSFIEVEELRKSSVEIKE